MKELCGQPLEEVENEIIGYAALLEEMWKDCCQDLLTWSRQIGMYEKLANYIMEFEAEDFGGDYWYDEGILIAEDMLQKFENSDWESLLQELPQKSVGWKCRLAYCLHDPESMKQLEVLLMLLETDDETLFEISLDSLRSFKDNQKVIQKRDEIVKKINVLLPKAGTVTKKIFFDFS